MDVLDFEGFQNHLQKSQGTKVHILVLVRSCFGPLHSVFVSGTEHCIQTSGPYRAGIGHVSQSYIGLLELDK
ncbi:hypothetical protein HanHA300_Chr08g0271511 [Helianthus annuus]|nr:hypothetical protein HanHA300_Chr08g0271511 [Helianthus annuus]KAJ0552736.1 hypothetical protein HanHA89_Chr08g0288501 [Helianthus annuus]KAJ0718416.1 hypothetical protein HanLR1_Chr08g0270351 [Helianthus annuus]